MKRQNGQKNRKRGFTLAEITITVAIIGILAAVAVPNYYRIKLQMNMEMVKQHMRIIGEKLTEILGKQGGQGPSRATWGNPAEGDEDELSLTSNLAAIDQKGYTTEDWIPAEEEGGYNFTSCPKDDAWGLSGDRCFRVDPFGIHEMTPWTGRWMGMNTWNQFSETQNVFDSLFNYTGPYLTQLNVFKELAEFAALLADYSRWQMKTMTVGGCGCDEDEEREKSYTTSTIPSENIPSSYFILDANQIGRLNEFLNAAKGDLEAKGIFIETRVQNVDQVIANCKMNCGELPNVIATTQNAKGLEVSFKLSDTVDSQSELTRRLPESNLAAILAKLK